MKKTVPLPALLFVASTFAQEATTIVSNCEVQGGLEYKNRLLIQQSESLVSDMEEGMRGLNRAFHFTIQDQNNQKTLEGIFESKGTHVEGHPRLSKRVVNSGLKELSGDRLGVLISNDKLLTAKKFKAKLIILDPKATVMPKTYKLECLNIKN